LGRELSLVYHGTLPVMMPNGFALYGRGAAVPAQRAALSQERPSGPGPPLGAAAISAVQRLAAAAGHPLQVGTVSTRTAASPTDYGAMAALAAAALLTVLAWGFSLPARPIGWRPQSRR
jgi:hypothetical protein